MLLGFRKTGGAFTVLEPHWDEADQERHEKQTGTDGDPPHQGISRNRFKLRIIAHSDFFGRAITATLGASGYLTR